MSALFSKRTCEKPSLFRYDIPADARSRILATLHQHFESQHNVSFGEYLADMASKLVRQYGHLHCSAYEAARTSDNPVIEHFFSCEDGKAADFIELTFSCGALMGANGIVDEINVIFSEEGIGYQLTRYQEVPVDHGVSIMEMRLPGNAFRYECPRIIRQDGQYEHEQIIEPALAVLSDKRFATANGEMVHAHQCLREQKFAAAITACSSAFESVLKTICESKGWTYDQEKDTCRALVSACRDHELFPPFYTSVLEGVATVRNKMGDAHGRGPKPLYTVVREHAEHALRVASSHIVFLINLARL